MSRGSGGGVSRWSALAATNCWGSWVAAPWAWCIRPAIRRLTGWSPSRSLPQAEELPPTERDQRRERFQREARAAGRLTHPNIVTVYDVGEDGGRAYLVMEFIEGQALDEILRTRRPLPLDEALAIGDQVAQALDYAHAHFIIHRDIKPANILMTRRGIAKVTDFGTARVTGTETTQTGQSLGTPSYMSPEQISGLKLDGREDPARAGPRVVRGGAWRFKPGALRTTVRGG